MIDLDYKSCKRLKDAGFPQGGTREPYCLKCEEWKEIDCLSKAHKIDFLVVPTLSELIDACEIKEGGTLTLYCHHYDIGTYDEWHAEMGYSNKDRDEEIGKTPEIAVANLYLKLNE